MQEERGEKGTELLAMYNHNSEEERQERREGDVGKRERREGEEQN